MLEEYQQNLNIPEHSCAGVTAIAAVSTAMAASEFPHEVPPDIGVHFEKASKRLKSLSLSTYFLVSACHPCFTRANRKHNLGLYLGLLFEKCQ